MEIKHTNLNNIVIDEKFRAKIALTQPGIQKFKGRCLYDHELAALVDNRLDSESYERALEHIDSCDSCYMEWVDIFSMKQEEKSKKRFIPYQKEIVSGLMALAAVFLVYIFIPPSDPLDNSYRIAKNNNITYESLMLNTSSSIDDQINRYVNKWKNTANNYQKVPQEQKAFAAGVYTALQPLSKLDKPVEFPEFIDTDLINQLDQEDTSLSIYYHLGRWCHLIKAIVDSTITIPTELWEEQLIFINYMSDRVEKCDRMLIVDKQNIAKIFKTIQDQFHNIQKDLSNHETRVNISGEVENFIIKVLTDWK